MPPFPVMCNKVGPRRLRNFEVRLRRLLGPRPRELIHLPVAPFPLSVCLNIFYRLLDIPFDIKGIARRFRYRQAEVKCEEPRYRPKSARVFLSVIASSHGIGSPKFHTLVYVRLEAVTNHGSSYPTMIRHILSTALAQAPLLEQSVTVSDNSRDSLNP